MTRREGSHAALTLGVALSLLLLPGCNDKRAAVENDRLRREVMEQEKQIKLLEGERDELTVKLAEESRVRESALPADVLEALPRCTGISVESLSGLVPADPKAPALGAVVYVEPQDGRGRFVQMVGTLGVEVILLAPSIGGSADTEPRRLAAVTLTPVELRDAYRSGITGTHYSVELKFEEPVELPAGGGFSLLIRVEFLDALTGQAHRADRTVAAR